MDITSDAVVPSRRRGSSSLSGDVLGIFIGVADAIIIALSGLVLLAMYVDSAVERLPLYAAVIGVYTTLSILVFYLNDLYKLDAVARPTRQLVRILALTGILFLTLVTFLFALKVSDQFSRVWAFSWFLVSTAGLVLTRAGISSLLVKRARAGRLNSNIIVVGGSNHGERLLGHLDGLDEPWNRVVGVFDDRLSRLGPEVAGYPVLGNLDDLVEYARGNRVDEILVALPWSAEERVHTILNKLKVLPVHVSLAPDLAALNFLPASYRSCAGVPVLDVFRKPIAGWHAILKQVEDFLIGSLLFLLALPAMALIAIAIKLDSRGPVLFRQPRYGLNNQLIEVFKFRTMYADRSDTAGAQLTRKGDPRITRVGAFLRKTSLDELPQFLNVLRGEMSIVGPRPHAVQAKAGDRLYHEVVAEYAARHKVKPGITGWAQINGWRGETSNDLQILKRVEHDLFYIENWSLGFDLRIILRTFWTVLRGENAM